MDIFTFILEIIGTVAFASSGAMLAIEKKMDIFEDIIQKEVEEVCSIHSRGDWFNLDKEENIFLWGKSKEIKDMHKYTK